MSAPTHHSVIIHSATLYDGTGGDPVTAGCLRADDGVITHTGHGTAWQSWPVATEVIDAAGAPVCPGYIDIHHHGAAGVAYDAGTAEAIDTAMAAHRAHGTTRCVISFVTDSLEAMEQHIRSAAAVVAANDHILGIHAEGPFLDPAHKGAHPLHELKDPTAENVTRLLDAGEGTIVQMTIAPEKTEGLDSVELLASRGVAAAVGHTDATYEIARDAFDRGARILTHAFNGMNGIHHRAPGPVVAALRDDRVFLEIINDTIHVHPQVVKSLFLEAPERTVLVTDSMSATCNPDGEYMLGQLEVVVADGVATLKGGTSLAGSTLTMDRAVANAVTIVGVAPELAIAAATTHPARAIGVDDRFGRLATGFPADVLILNPETFLPELVYTDGKALDLTKD